MKKLIILDFSSRTVVVMPSGKNPERTFETWCEKNKVRPRDCCWMAWGGKIKHTK